MACRKKKGRWTGSISEMHFGVFSLAFPKANLRVPTTTLGKNASRCPRRPHTTLLLRRALLLRGVTVERARDAVRRAEVTAEVTGRRPHPLGRPALPDWKIKFFMKK